MFDLIKIGLIAAWGIFVLLGYGFLVSFTAGRLFDLLFEKKSLKQSWDGWWHWNTSWLYKVSGIVGVPAVILSVFLEVSFPGYVFSKDGTEYLGRSRGFQVMAQWNYNEYKRTHDVRSIDSMPVYSARLTNGYSLYIQCIRAGNEEQIVRLLMDAIRLKADDGEEFVSVVNSCLERDPSVRSNLEAFVSALGKSPYPGFREELVHVDRVTRTIDEPLKQYGLIVDHVEIRKN